jgi:hypothetical protein
LLARIIAVAATFDAATTNRPYQTAHDPLDALPIVYSRAGKRLDPESGAALNRVFERGDIGFSGSSKLLLLPVLTAPRRQQGQLPETPLGHTSPIGKLGSTRCESDRLFCHPSIKKSDDCP